MKRRAKQALSVIIEILTFDTAAVKKKNKRKLYLYIYRVVIMSMLSAEIFFLINEKKFRCHYCNSYLICNHSKKKLLFGAISFAILLKH